jgi:integrase
MIALSPSLCTLLDDWLRDTRPGVTDAHDREPLVATRQGRPHAQTIQKWAYAYTRPCVYADDCPEDRDPATCEATQTTGSASKCPASVSPHAIRRGSITHWLQHDVPMHVVSDRANVSQGVLATHYDRRTERERVDQRRKYLDHI